jgi:hypothetical protein
VSTSPGVSPARAVRGPVPAHAGRMSRHQRRTYMQILYIKREGIRSWFHKWKVALSRPLCLGESTEPRQSMQTYPLLGFSPCPGILWSMEAPWQTTLTNKQRNENENHLEKAPMFDVTSSTRCSRTNNEPRLGLFTMQTRLYIMAFQRMGRLVASHVVVHCVCRMNELGVSDCQSPYQENTLSMNSAHRGYLLTGLNCGNQ